MESTEANNSIEKGTLEWLFGCAAAKILDFLIAYKDFDYSETDIADKSGLSLKTVLKEIPRFESTDIVTHTRKVGRAKMYRLNSNSEAVKCLRQFEFLIATKQVTDSINGIEPLQQKISNEENLIKNQ